MRLAHGWKLDDRYGVETVVLREGVRPAVRAVPPVLAARIGPCRITLFGSLEIPIAASQWRFLPGVFELHLAVSEVEAHDLAMELLRCVGQGLWYIATPWERDTYLGLIDREITTGVPGEISPELQDEKRRLTRRRGPASSLDEVASYVAESFAVSLAEYVHCLWHDVEARTGPRHLPAEALARRLRLFERWFPPGPGYRLFPRSIQT